MQTYIFALKDLGHLAYKLPSYTRAPVCWKDRLTNIRPNYRVKLSLWSIKHKDMRTCGGVKRLLHSFLNSAQDRGEKSGRLAHSIPSKRHPATHWIKRLGRAQNQHGRFEEDKFRFLSL
jgi:hypothetical protein